MKMAGRRVTHRRFGDGIVNSCENGVIQILFQDYGARRFHYPEAFDRFLTSDDEELSECAREDLGAWKLGQEAEDARVVQLCIDRAREARTKKTEKPKVEKTAKTKAAKATKK
jgi:hypothetical protein